MLDQIEPERLRSNQRIDLDLGREIVIGQDRRGVFVKPLMQLGDVLLLYLHSRRRGVAAELFEEILAGRQRIEQMKI